MKKRKQHFVWEHYLTGWADGSVLHCEHDGRCFKASTENVANQRDFYRLQELSDADLFYVGKLAEKFPEPIPMLARQWISFFESPFALRHLYESGQVKDQEFEAAFDETCNNLEEDIHARFERKAVPLLAALKQLDASPIFDNSAGVDATMFLSLQYLRTPGMMKRIAAVDSHDLPGFNLAAAWGVLRAIYASAFARGLYERQANMLVSFLLAPPERGLITGDQPIVNTRAQPLGSPPTEIELYYPLSPRVGILLSLDASVATSRQIQLSISQADMYNRIIANARDRQIYGASLGDLVASASTTAVV